LALLLVSPAQAQEPDPAPLLGQRVRVSTPNGPSVTGKLVEQDGTKLVVSDQKGSLTAIPVADVSRIELSAGRKSKALLGAVIGAAVGLGVGLWAATTWCSESGCDNEVGGVLVLGVGGAGLGALVGAAVRTERWRQVPAGQPESRLPPGSSGWRVSMTFRF
jgi:hypothetical protein